MKAKKKAEKRTKRRLNASKRANEHKSGSRYLKIPDGARMVRITKPDDEVKIDVIPYVCSENCTKFAGNDKEPGDLAFERTIYVHGYCVGPQKDSVICAAKTFGKKCYPCEWLDKNPLPMDATKDQKTERGKLYAKERNIWNWRVEGEEDKGCQIADQSVKTFGESVFTKIKSTKDPKRRAKFEVFADPDDGMSINITPKSKPMGEGQSFVSCEQIEFVQRENEVGDEWVEKAWCLDDMVECPDYKEIKEKFLSGSKSDEQEIEGTDDENADDDELPEAPCGKGDTIEFKHKGKTKTGKAVKVDEEEAEVKVKLKDGSIVTIDFDDVIQPDEEDEDEDEDQDGEDDEGGEEDDESDDDGDVEDGDADEEEDELDEEDVEDDDEEEDDEPQVVKGSVVTWTSKKSGRKLSGKVTSVNHKNGVAAVVYDPTKKAIAVDIEDLTVANPGKGRKAEEEEITTLRANKKGGKKPAGKKRKLVEDDDDSF